MGDLVLTIDAGTGSVRALVYDVKRQALRSIATRTPRVNHPDANRAEFSPEEWWQATIDAVREAVEKTGEPRGSYLGLTVTSFRQGFILLDKAGEPLAPGILNYDKRGETGIPRISNRIDSEKLYHLTGHWHAPELTLPKLLWFQEEQTAIWKQTASFLFVHDWLLYQLSGEKATNATMVCAGQMGNVAQRTWAEDLLNDLDISSEILPPIYETGFRLGGLRDEVARAVGLVEGTPVFIGGGDAQFANLGSGGMRDGALVIVGGSTTPLMLSVTDTIFDSDRYPWVSTHLDPHLWVIETNAGQTGMIFTWFRDLCRQILPGESVDKQKVTYEVLDQLAALSPPGANGLQVIASSPRWAEDTWKEKAPYTIFGFTVAHDAGDIARAIMEGVCYAIRGNVEQMERVAGETCAHLIYTGGTTKSRFWVQMMADVLERPVMIPSLVESAAVAGAQIVLWSDPASVSFPLPEYRVVDPKPRESEVYHKHYRSYVRNFEQLQKHFSSE